MRVGNVEIKWLGHSGFMLKDVLHDRVFYIDPYQVSLADPESADAVLITHSHHDHCSIEDLQKVCTEKTVIFAPADCQSKFQGKVALRDARILAPGSEIVMGNIEIEAVPAYNTDKDFHPKDNEWVGYVVSMNSKRIYHAGDSDKIPEMNDLHKIDVALVPVSGKFVMTSEEAAKAVEGFKPKLAIPMHYGAIVGDLSDAETFKELCEVPVEILDKE